MKKDSNEQPDINSLQADNKFLREDRAGLLQRVKLLLDIHEDFLQCEADKHVSELRRINGRLKRIRNARLEEVNSER